MKNIRLEILHKGDSVSALTSDEIKKLEIMYAGDKARDATSKIRGFLYQDYVTIRCLLQDNVEYVCSEYLEDIDVFYDDGKFEYIQVKYYPASEPKLDEISTDLYYQYQRLMLLQSKLKVVPQLYIHRERKTRKLTKKRLENYVRKIAGIPNLLTSKENDDIELWLEQNINIITDKDLCIILHYLIYKKKIFFDKWASIESIEKFVDVMKIVHTENISDYKQKLMKKLSDTYPNPVEEGDDEKWGMILLGLAIIYIQRRYNVEQNSFNSIRMTRIEFDKYMKSYTQTKTEKTIVAYLLECITEVYNSIIMYNTSLSNMKKIMLDRICHNTLNWINILGSTKEGQYRLLYTCSYAEVSQLNNFKNMDISHRLGMIHEAREAFVDFLKYLWKIMLDISVKNVKSITQISDHRWLFDPVTYVDDSQKDFICLNFPEDYTNCSVILPAAKGTFKGTKRKLIDRFINLRHVPEKWFFNNNDDMQGENYYNYRVTDIRKKATIAERERDGFWIECMHCIGIDEGDWDKVEDCSMCIFKDTCVRGE